MINYHLKQDERRLHPRIKKELPLKLAFGDGYDIVTTTEDVSCLGAYCHVNKYIPPFTKIAVKLRLPQIFKRSNKALDVECNGVVVRSLDGEDGGFNIAIFFNEIKESQRKIISQYVNQIISRENCPA